MTPPEQPTPRVPVLVIFLIFPLLGLVAALVIILSGDAPGATGEPTPLPVRLPSATQPQWQNATAPDFELRALDQTMVALSAYRGRIVFLNFWATWCVPCERELPAFQDFMRDQTGDDSPLVLAVNIGEPFDQVDPWLRGRGLGDIPVLLDVYFDTADLYGIGPIPVTFVLDENGVIRHTKFGEMTREEMDAYIEAVEAGT
jgi:peroxiredoxin